MAAVLCAYCLNPSDCDFGDLVVCKKCHLSIYETHLAPHHQNQVSAEAELDRNSKAYVIEKLPNELLWAILDHLKDDDTALHSAMNVSTRWRENVIAKFGQFYFEARVKKIWPLLHPKIRDVADDDEEEVWSTFFDLLLKRSSCKQCLLRYARIERPEEWNTPFYLDGLAEVLDPVIKDSGIDVVPVDYDSEYWNVTLDGPTGSPYEGGTFNVLLHLPYPGNIQDPPSVRFDSKIYHPLVNAHGDLSFSISEYDWSWSCITSMVLFVKSILVEPFQGPFLNPGAAHLYTLNPADFRANARAWTEIYASVVL